MAANPELLIFNDFGTVKGGADQVATQSALGLATQKQSVTFVCGDSLGNTEAALFTRANIQLIQLKQKSIHQLSKLEGIQQGLWNENAYHEAKKLFTESKQKGPTIAHFHSFTKILSSSVIAAALESEINIFVTLHDYFFFCPNGAYYNHKTQENCSLKPLSFKCLLTNCDKNNYLQKVFRLVRSYKQRGHGLNSHESRIHFLTVSNLAKEKIQEHTGVKPTVVLNPINVTKEERITVEKNKYITYVGRLSEEKGILELATVCQKNNIPIKFIGEGDAAKKIKAINPEAVLTGWMEKKTLAQEMKTARAVVLPSKWHETFGLTVPESLSLGIPVIVSDLVGAKDLVQENDNGFIFQHSRVDQLEQFIAKCMDDTIIEKLSKHAYLSYWKSPQNKAQHAQALILEYQKALNLNNE